MNTIVKSLSIFVVFFCCCSSVAVASDNMFGKLSNNVEDYLVLRERYNKAADGSWLPNPFSDTKHSVRKDINAVLDKALEILLDDRLVEKKKEIAKLNANINDCQQQIADLKMKSLSAPDEKKAYELWVDDSKDIDKKITHNQNQIVKNQKHIAEVKQVMRSMLAESGVKLSMPEIDNLVNTVSGDDTLHTIVALKNIQIIIERLKGLMMQENENIHIAKKYYGLFLLATETYAFQLESSVHNIDKKYLPKLEDLRKQNATLMAETKKMAAQDAHYASNLKAQQVTEAAVQMYEKVLVQQKKRLGERQKEVQKIWALAENTYQTVSIAHSLYETINESLATYEKLINLPLVAPVSFQNKDMEAKFKELTQRLQE